MALSHQDHSDECFLVESESDFEVVTQLVVAGKGPSSHLQYMVSTTI